MDINDRLINWAICQSYGPQGKGRCESIEWMYSMHREHLREDEEEDRRSPKHIKDEKDAELVEKAWQRLQNPIDRNMLKLAYIHRATPQFICRKLKIQITRDLRHFLLRLHTAKHNISTLLDRMAQDHVESEKFVVSVVRRVELRGSQDFASVD